MPAEQPTKWSLSEGFPDFQPENKEDRQHFEYVNIAEKLGQDSDLSEVEKLETSITSETSCKVYTTALQRSDCPPVLIGMPHAGELVPKEILDRIARPEALGGQGGLDTGTTSIFAPRNDEFVGVRARVNRIVVDLNREPTDFAGKPPSQKGICWETDMVGQPIYKPGQELSLEEKKKMIGDVYDPYFKRLHALAGSLLDRRTEDNKPFNPKILFIDGHSFPGDEPVPAYGISAEEPKPLIIVGTGEGKVLIPGADDAVVQALMDKINQLIPDELLRDEKYLSGKVVLNKIWTGTKNIKYWGKKEEPLTPNGQQSQAIQIEVNRQFFMQGGKYDRTRLDLLHDAIYAGIQAALEVLQYKH